MFDNTFADFFFFFFFCFYLFTLFYFFFVFFLDLRILNTNENYTLSAMRNLLRMAAGVERPFFFEIIIRRFNFECATRPVFQYFYPVRIPQPSNGAK